jgi:hypothetical protein
VGKAAWRATSLLTVISLRIPWVDCVRERKISRMEAKKAKDEEKPEKKTMRCH